jgi:hypothetical protein
VTGTAWHPASFADQRARQMGDSARSLVDVVRPSRRRSKQPLRAAKPAGEAPTKEPAAPRSQRTPVPSAWTVNSVRTVRRTEFQAIFLLEPSYWNLPTGQWRASAYAPTASGARSGLGDNWRELKLTRLSRRRLPGAVVYISLTSTGAFT